MSTLTYGFIGLGLIGGSIAKAIRLHMPDAHLLAYDINTASLELAKKEQIIDEICTAIDASFRDCDYLFLCAPVSHNAENLLTIKSFLSPDTILTDVGSVKTGIHTPLRPCGGGESQGGGCRHRNLHPGHRGGEHHLR